MEVSRLHFFYLLGRIAGWPFVLAIGIAVLFAYQLYRMPLKSCGLQLLWACLAVMQFILMFIVVTRWTAAAWHLTLFLIPQNPGMQYHPTMIELWLSAIKPPLETFHGYVIEYDLYDYIQSLIIVIVSGSIFTLIPAILRTKPSQNNRDGI